MRWNKESRHGKHRESKVLLGGMVEPRIKAITLVTAAVYANEEKPLSQTDIIWKGISELAKSAKILDKDGNVTKQYKDVVALMEASVKEASANHSRAGRW